MSSTYKTVRSYEMYDDTVVQLFELTEKAVITSSNELRVKRSFTLQKRAKFVQISEKTCPSIDYDIDRLQWYGPAFREWPAFRTLKISGLAMNGTL